MSALPVVETEHRSDMHRRIIRAAEHCFSEFGPARTTMVDVARVTGVSRPTVYRYFRDREALLVEVVVRRVRAALSTAERILEAGERFGQALLDCIVLLVDRGRDDPMIRKLFVEQDQVSNEIWPVALGLSLEFWEPVLSDAQARGDLRDGLVLDEACAWLTEVLLFLVGRSPRDGALETARVIREFVVPALTGSPVTA
ncbi:TetR/AcrR family transcriptional regulator [Actinomycetospora sp. TBRC 11914]|uniref:TetR/AcrR family transcriptional regulator n=1 Tax=Actinomycetospora sp. TBRC 11914 TaxID=2729387 RepID=UPI00145CE03F|nr:TetR/AcrR family transcriptional regulator [Actinomycetospora sp. TBRC 11914]NMO91613.1 TetR/AcrR family transcriptional regulator [Actinomycetospora sp. TBRC 11914]